MTKTFKTAAAFKTSFEHRLKDLAASRGTPLDTLRLKVVMERLLARLFAQSAPPWLLKGGYAMELRYRPNARTTRDLDLSISRSQPPDERETLLESIRDDLQASAEVDLGDFMQFRIGNYKTELTGAPLGGARFPCEAILAGKTYARFHIDVGIGDPVAGPPDEIKGDDILAFAGIMPPTVLAIPREPQFAEKVHAYTFPWADRTNTRTKDLVDLLMLIESGFSDPAALRVSIRQTFAARNSHSIPAQLPPPPIEWKHDYSALAAETDLSTDNLSDAYERLRQFWSGNQLGLTGTG